METYQEYKARKGITNEHQATIELGIDAMRIIGENLKKANELTEERRKLN